MTHPKPEFKSRYENFVGGQWTPPVGGEYFANSSPIDGNDFCEVPRSKAADIELALDAAHKAAPTWTTTAVAERSSLLLKIADRMEQNLERLAAVETWDNGKSIRETLAADLPLASPKAMIPPIDVPATMSKMSVMGLPTPSSIASSTRAV